MKKKSGKGTKVKGGGAGAVHNFTGSFGCSERVERVIWAEFGEEKRD